MNQGCLAISAMWWPVMRIILSRNWGRLDKQDLDGCVGFGASSAVRTPEKVPQWNPTQHRHTAYDASNRIAQAE
jgi:hypothetical protein